MAVNDQANTQQIWKGTELLDLTLDKVWRFSSQSLSGGRRDAAS